MRAACAEDSGADPDTADAVAESARRLFAGGAAGGIGYFRGLKAGGAAGGAAAMAANRGGAGLSSDEYDPVLCEVHKGYMTLFLLINTVLFLNFVIAILSSTFAYYEDKQVGLYYEVLVALFPAMEYDERYGAVVCAQPPFNLMILPF